MHCKAEIETVAETVAALAKANLTKHVGAFIEQGIKPSDFANLQDVALDRMNLTVKERQSFRRAFAGAVHRMFHFC